MRYDENGKLISNEESHAVEQEFSTEDLASSGMTNETFDEYTSENEMNHPEEKNCSRKKRVNRCIK